MSSTPAAANAVGAAARYDPVAIALHWALALALLAQIAFGIGLDEIAPRGTPARAGIVNLHKSFGVVLGGLVLARLGWRLTHPAPAWPASMTAAQQLAARWGHRALYACMVAMPLTGYVASNVSKHGIVFFGWRWPAWGGDRPAAYAFFNGLHDVTAWVFVVLIAGHVLIAIRHASVDRDDVLQRMWPPRGRAP